MLILLLWFVFYLLKTLLFSFFFPFHISELADKFPSSYTGALQNLGDLLENLV